LKIKNKRYGLFDMALISFKLTPFCASFFALDMLISSLIPTATIFITASFINTAIAVYEGSEHITAVYLPIGLLAATLLYQRLKQILKNIFSAVVRMKHRAYLEMIQVERNAQMSIKLLEDSNASDIVKRIRKFDTRVWEIYVGLLDIAGLAVTVLGVVIVLFTQVWWVAAAMAFIGAPLAYIAVKAGQKAYDAEKEVTNLQRRSDYLSDVLTNRNAAEERYVFGYTEKIDERYYENFEIARKHNLKVQLKNQIRQSGAGILTTLIAVGVILALLQPVINGDMEIGMYVALTTSVFGLIGQLKWGLASRLNQLSVDREWLKDFTDYTALEYDEISTAEPTKDVDFNIIEFRNVRFTYPGTNKVVLDGVDLTIEKGKHYAFVGVNGCGKTTIVNLLTGFYDNYEGEILIDGKPLRQFNQAQIKGLTTVVYQRFARYYMTLYDNIAIADPDAWDSTDETFRARAMDAAVAVGLRETIEKLPDGMDTILGKELRGGVDLSGGQWQRVAMARCIMSKAPLKILDEPTAALDPVSESRVYHNFEQISRGATTVFISHRLGSTKLADVIYVIDGGKVIESGSHERLVRNGGLYGEMFSSQAGWYAE
jgi:ATP-binding cassette subfamily B protein